MKARPFPHRTIRLIAAIATCITMSACAEQTPPSVTPVPTMTQTPIQVETPTPFPLTKFPGIIRAATPQTSQKTPVPPTPATLPRPLPTGTPTGAEPTAPTPMPATTLPTPITQPQGGIAGIAISPQNPHLRQEDLPITLRVYARYPDNTYGPIPEPRTHSITFSIHPASHRPYPIRVGKNGHLTAGIQPDTGKTHGTIFVTATYGHHQDTTTATLAPPPQNKVEDMTNLVLDIPSPSLQAGDTAQIEITATYQDGHTGPLPIDFTQPTRLSSSNENIVTVDQRGSLKALFPGQALITVTAATHTATIVVAVTPSHNPANTAKGCPATGSSTPIPNTIMVELNRGNNDEDAASLARQHGATLLPKNSPTGHFLQFQCTPGDTPSQMQKLTQLVSNIKADHRVKEAIPVTIAGPTTPGTQQTPTPTPPTPIPTGAAPSTPTCSHAAAITTDPDILELTPGIPRTLNQVTLHCSDRTNVLLNPAHPDVTYSTEQPDAPIQTGPQGRITATRKSPTSNHIIIITHGPNRHRLSAQVRAGHTGQNIETDYCTPDNRHTAKLLIELAPDIKPAPTNPDLKRLTSRANAEIEFTFHPGTDTPLNKKLRAAVLTVSCSSTRHLLDQLQKLQKHSLITKAQPYLPLNGDTPGTSHTLTTHQEHLTLKTGDSILITPVAHYPNGTQRFLTDDQMKSLTLQVTPPDSAHIQHGTNKLTALKPGDSVLTMGSNDPNTGGQTHTIPLTIVQ